MDRMKIAAIFADQEQLGGKEITVCGWARTIRDMKTFGFIELNDGSCFRNLGQLGKHLFGGFLADCLGCDQIAACFFLDFLNHRHKGVLNRGLVCLISGNFHGIAAIMELVVKSRVMRPLRQLRSRLRPMARPYSFERPSSLMTEFTFTALRERADHGAVDKIHFESVGLFKLRQTSNDLPVLRLCLFRDGSCGGCIIAQHSGQLLLKGA